MRKTFVCDESIIITIPIRSLKSIREGQLMPENFHCVFIDNFKVFTVGGKPRPLGAAQAIAGVFLFTLGMLCAETFSRTYTVPSVVFLICGMLSYAAGRSPNMHVVRIKLWVESVEKAKLSFSLNIISFFWSLVAFSVCLSLLHQNPRTQFSDGIQGLILTLLVVESIIALFLIYWLSKAVCRAHFNALPIIMLKQDD